MMDNTSTSGFVIICDRLMGQAGQSLGLHQWYDLSNVFSISYWFRIVIEKRVLPPRVLQDTLVAVLHW